MTLQEFLDQLSRASHPHGRTRGPYATLCDHLEMLHRELQKNPYFSKAMKEEIDCDQCLPEGLCSSCFEGQLRDETSDFVCDPIQGRTITVKDLPCTKCDKCDERFYSPAAARRIEDAVEKLREEMGLEPLLREPRNMDEDGVGCKPQDNVSELEILSQLISWPPNQK